MFVKIFRNKLITLIEEKIKIFRIKIKKIVNIKLRK